MKIDQKIQDRLEKLIQMGEKVLATKRNPAPNIIGDDRVVFDDSLSRLNTFCPPDITNQRGASPDVSLRMDCGNSAGRMELLWHRSLKWIQ